MLYYSGDPVAIRQIADRGAVFLRENRLINLRELSNDNGTVTLKAKISDEFHFITKNNIGRFVRYAIDNQKLQCQLLLMHYQAEQQWQKPKKLFL